METVTALVTKMDALIGCLGCGEPVPEHSLSDLFCARMEPGDPNCHEECPFCGPHVVTCQDIALDRMGFETDEVYDRDDHGTVGASDHIWARWWPGRENGEPATRLSREDRDEPWTWARGVEWSETWDQ